MQIKLTVISDSLEKGATKIFDKKEITLGSSPQSDLVLDSPGVEKSHASLRFVSNNNSKPPLVYVKDLGSKAGTRVEENSLSSQVEVQLLPDERIQIGNYYIKPSFEENDYQHGFVEQKSSATIFLKGNNVEDVDFEARELFSLSGRVMYRGKPLKRVTIDAGEHGRAETNLNGSFAFHDLVEGSKYSFSVSKPGFAFEATPLEGVVSRDLNHSIEATQLFTIAGTVLRMGEPLLGVELDAGSLGTFTTDQYGRFMIENVPEFTDYDLIPKKEGFIFSTPGAKGTLDGEPVSLLFTSRKLMSVSGRVIHKGQPISGVRIRACGPDEKYSSTMLTNAEGRYLFPDVPEGKEYTLKIDREKYIFKQTK